MSKLLRRALKISLVPAILMITGKFFGILVPILIFNLEFTVENEIAGMSSIQIFFADNSTTLFINSISNLSMLILLAIPTLYIITKTSIYQSTLQNPKTIVKITKLNILKWITRKDSSLLQIFIWSSFLVIASSIIVIHTLQGDTFPWIGILAGTVALLTIWGAIKTFELEIDRIYPRDNKYY